MTRIGSFIKRYPVLRYFAVTFAISWGGVLSLASPAFLPSILTTDNRLGFILSGIVVGHFFGGLLEELGWTGFAVPRLRQKNGAASTGLFIGFLWGLWHFLPANGVLMVWVYERNGESLLVALFMHASLTASTLFILSPSVKNVSLMIYYLILAAALWIVVAAFTGTKGGFSRQQLTRLVA